MIAGNLPQKKIANPGVVSYAPTIYFLKLKDFLDKGYRVKEVVVYIDISDIQTGTEKLTFTGPKNRAAGITPPPYAIH